MVLLQCGKIEIEWQIVGEMAVVNVTVPPNTTAEIEIPGLETESVGSGKYVYTVCVR